MGASQASPTAFHQRTSSRIATRVNATCSIGTLAWLVGQTNATVTHVSGALEVDGGVIIKRTTIGDGVMQVPCSGVACVSAASAAPLTQQDTRDEATLRVSISFVLGT